MLNPMSVGAKQNPETCEWEVRNLLTGELLATFDSRYLAYRMVGTINRNLSK